MTSRLVSGDTANSKITVSFASIQYIDALIRHSTVFKGISRRYIIKPKQDPSNSLAITEAPGIKKPATTIKVICLPDNITNRRNAFANKLLLSYHACS